MFSKTTTGLVALTILSDEVLAMKLKYRPLAGTAPWHKDAEANSWVKPTWDVDYFVPNFGVDPEVSNIAASIAETEKLMGKTFDLPSEESQKPAYKTGYTVPNFGTDHDILNVKDAISKTEAKLDYKWTPTKDENGVYEVPQPINAAAYSYRG